MEMNQYLDIFIEESREHLQSMNDNLLNLEKNSKDIGLINEIFRIAHTLKGMSATMGFAKTASLTHEMENLLHAIRGAEIHVSPEIIDILFKCFDTLEEYIGNISLNSEEGELSSTELISEINNALNVEVENIKSSQEDKQEHAFNEYVSNILAKAKQKGLNSFNITIHLSKDCMLKSARAFIIFNTLEANCEIVQSIPSAEDIEDENFDVTFLVTIVTKLEESQVHKNLISISEVEKVEIEEIFIGNEINNEEINEVNSEISLTSSLEEHSTNETEENSDNNEKKVPEIHTKKTQNNKIGKTVRVDIDRLDNLMNLVSELIIIKTRMEDVSGSKEKENMNEAIEYLERITTNLHDAVMKVRMVPIERVFNRFPRMVRDLSKELGKEINLQMSGEETEVDRTVIDEIGDPLIHLIRNSIDHGIEAPETRKKKGKNEFGTVELKAYPDGNNVVIEVQDDGNGIDVDKVRKKGIEKGLVSEEKAFDMPKEDIIDLLFKAGFSTSDTVSDISGRGVGLDVVKTKIESIGGIIETDTSKGIGTKFIIRIPLTLAIIQALLIKLNDEIYAIPLSSIGEISTINSKNIRKVQNQEVILFRNKTLPLIRLNKILGIDNENIEDELTVVIVKKGDKEAGLIVDKLIGQQEIVIKSLGKFLNGIKFLAGATILGNGQISLILDVNSIF